MLLIATAVAGLSTAIVSGSMLDVPVSWAHRLAQQLPAYGQDAVQPKMPGAQAKPGAPEQPPSSDKTLALLVKTVAGLSEEGIESLMKRHGAAKQRGIGRLRLHSVTVPKQALEAMMKRLQEDPQVERVELDRPRRIAGEVTPPSDPGHATQWALETTGWNASWQFVNLLGTARIAVLDTGVSPAAGELALGDGWSAFGTDPKRDPNGHGTWVASIAAATANNDAGIAGVSFSKTTVLPVQVLDVNGEGQDSDIIAGVEWAIANDANVILMAFSNPGFSQSLQEAIDLAWSSGIVVVAATGNDASATPTFPAGDSKVVGVSATDQSDALWSFSNYGKTAFMAAPGVGVSVLNPDGAVLSTSGTSASAAMVAGAAALLKIADPTATNGVIVGRLARNADVAGTQEQTGNGRLNIQRALADSSYEEVVPLGAPPEGDGGPYVGPYVAAARNLTINFAGSGDGTVAFSNLTPAAAPQVCTSDAGDICRRSLDNNQKGTLTATAAAGSTFAGWSNASFPSGGGSTGTTTCDGTTNPCTFTIGNRDSSVTATFTANAHTTTTLTRIVGEDPGTYGDTLTFRAVVSPSAGSVGSVTFKSGTAVLCSAVVLSASAAACSPSLPVGVYNVVAEYSGGPNFSGSTSSMLSQSVDPKALTVTGISASNKVYDGLTTATLSTTSAALVGVVSGDSIALDATSAVGAFADRNVGTGKSVTISGLTISGTAASNYSLVDPTASANITAKGLAIEGATAQHRAYDGTTTATVNFGSAVLAGVIPPDVVAIDTSNYSANFQSKTVGDSKLVTVTGVVLTGADASNYTAGQPSGLSANITAKNLTVNGAFANSREYDGGTSATVDFASATLVGLIGPDAVTINAGGCRASFASKAVGSGKPVTVTGVALGGADADNYTVSQPSGLTANITAKFVTGGFTAADKVYDGNTSATVTDRSLTGAISGDLVTLSGGTATFDTRSVGTAKTVTLTGATLEGIDAANYSLGQMSTANADITPKEVTGSFAAADKIYEGTTAATVTDRSLSGSISADNVSLTGGTASFDTKHVGNEKTVTLSGATLEGVDAGNYTLSAVSTAMANITPRDVTGSFTAQDKMYDGLVTAVVLTRSIDGMVSGDDLTLSGGNAAFADKDVDNDKTITLSGATLAGADAGNYRLTFVATATASISPAIITPLVAVDNKTYDGTTVATISGRTFTSGSPLVPGESVELQGGVAAFADADAGTGKPVTVTGLALGAADAANYQLSSTIATATADIRPKVASVTPNAAAKTYGDAEPTLAGTMEGFLSGDNVTAAYSRTTGESVGTYTISGTLSPAAVLGNYDITYNTAQFAITARAVAIKANDVTRIYGDSTPAFTLAVAAGSLAPGDDLAMLGTPLFSPEGANVGTHRINVSGLTSTNYDLSYAIGDARGVLTITPRILTVTADPQTRVYGNPDPELTYKITNGNLVGDDAFSGALDRLAGENVGPYAIKQNTLTLGPNYTLAFNGAILTITPRPVTVAAENKTKIYGDADPALTYQVTHGSLAFNDAFTGGLARTAGENVGPYAIQQGSLALNANYTLSYSGSNLTINPRPISITADPKSKPFGAADPPFTYQLTGGSLVGADVLTGTLTRQPGEAVGTYPILQGTLTAGSNYSVTYAAANLTIAAWTVTGFYTPIAANTSFIVTPSGTVPAANATTAWNSAKGGSSIPLKFDIFRNGLSMPESTNVADVKSFQATELLGCTAAGEDPIEVLPGTSLDIMTSLKYDGEQFHQNWKTPAVKRDTCYRVTVTLQDNTAIHTFVKLKK